MPMSVDEKLTYNMLDPDTKQGFVAPVTLIPCEHTVNLATAKIFHGFTKEHTTNQNGIKPCLVCNKPVTGCIPNDALRMALGQD